MRRQGLLIFLATISCLASQAIAQQVDDQASPHNDTSTDIDTVPTNGTPPAADSTVVYVSPTPHAGAEHAHEEPSMDMGMGMGMGMDMGDMNAAPHNPSVVDGPIPPEQMSYWLWPEHRALLYTHAIIMTIAWGFLLPVGVMLGVAHSTFHIPVQIAFIVLNAIGVVFAIMYNSATPDFYENNAHHKIGWVIVWALLAQLVSGFIRGVARYVNKEASPTIDDHAENMFMLGSEDEEEEDAHEMKEIGAEGSDSGHGTGETSRAGSTSDGPTSPFVIRRSSENTLLNEREYNRFTTRPRNTEGLMEKFIAKKLEKQGWISRISQRTSFIAKIVHAVIGRPLWCLGFIQLCTGIVTVTGIFKRDDVYNGLAHFIKGGIFFNYGVITLGRYLGVFADFGWAWNLKPPGELMGQKWKNRVPSGEFVESFFICLYGSTQSFMEHLGNSNGGIWSHKDLQHVSIAIMFFWAGLCGLLIETPWLKNCFNRTIEAALSHRSAYQILRQSSENAEATDNAAMAPPAQQNFSYNPFPGLIIFMTGIMMSMHTQESMLSTMVHKQWGYLLAGFSFFRLCTYIMVYIRPPTSYLPTRPITELLTSFCLICGGLIFMASNENTVSALESRDVDAMFVFNLSVAFSTLVMAWIIIVMGIKGWAVHRRQLQQQH